MIGLYRDPRELCSERNADYFKIQENYDIEINRVYDFIHRKVIDIK